MQAIGIWLMALGAAALAVVGVHRLLVRYSFLEPPRRGSSRRLQRFAKRFGLPAAVALFAIGGALALLAPEADPEVADGTTPAQTDRAAGSAPAASEAIEQARQAARMPERPTSERVDILLTLARLEAALGHPSEARALAIEAGDLCGSGSTPACTASVTLALGRIQAAAGTPGAEETLTAAASLYRAAGMAEWAAVASAEAGLAARGEAVGGALRDSPPPTASAMAERRPPDGPGSPILPPPILLTPPPVPPTMRPSQLRADSQSPARVELTPSEQTPAQPPALPPAPATAGSSSPPAPTSFTLPTAPARPPAIAPEPVPTGVASLPGPPAVPTTVPMPTPPPSERQTAAATAGPPPVPRPPPGETAAARTEPSRAAPAPSEPGRASVAIPKPAPGGAGGAPRIEKVSAPAPGRYTAGANLNVVVTFDRPIAIGGFPVVHVGFDNGTGVAPLVPSSSDRHAIFRYQVTPQDVDRNGIDVLSPIVLNGGSIVGADGTPASLAFTPPDTARVLVGEAGAAAAAPPPTGAAPTAPPAEPTAGSSEAGSNDAGPYWVQLAALRSEEAAEAEWQRLAREQPALLGGVGHDVRRIVTAAGFALYRLRSGPFDDPERARHICRVLASNGVACFVGGS